MNAIDQHRALFKAEPVIQRLSRRLLRQHPDAIEDGQQEARLRLLEALPRFNSARGDIGGFTYRVVSNAIRDLRRSLRANHRQARALPDDLSGDSCDGGAEALATEITTNPERYLTKGKSALLRALFASGNRSDLAAHLGIPIDRCNERVSRLRRDLRELAVA